MFPSSSNSSTPRFLSLFHERNESKAKRGRWSRATNRGGTSSATVAGHLAAVPRSRPALVTAIRPQPHRVGDARQRDSPVVSYQDLSGWLYNRQMISSAIRDRHASYASM
ncbi:uncharacterized protein DS421_17g581800 [Arachis hypogaea]|nr:uncharacterized protein DS421_17g581800 [Arachis hypogaea]